MILLCGMLSASICKSVTLNLYDAAVAYEQNIKTFVSVLPAATEATSRPDATKAENVLDVIKGMVAKCNNTIDHMDPAFIDVKNVLQTVLVNDLILQKSGPFAEPGLIKARECALAASNKLMALLVEIPAPAPGSERAVAKKSDDSGEDDNEDDEEENSDEEESDDDEEDDEDDSEE